MNLVRMRIISEQRKITCTLKMFIFLNCFARSRRTLSQLAARNIVDLALLAKSLLLPHIPFYVCYIKETRYCLHHDESKDVFAAGVGLETAEI